MDFDSDQIFWIAVALVGLVAAIVTGGIGGLIGALLVGIGVFQAARK